MKKCPKCNAQYGDGATYCEVCGTKLTKYTRCPQCGSDIPDDSAFCPRCGKNLNVDRTPISFAGTSDTTNVVDDATIERYKREIVDYKARRRTFLILGGIFLGVGLVLFILFTVLMANTANKMVEGNYYDSLYVTYIFLMILSEFVLDAGIVFMIIQGAVFGRKIANRERAIQEYEARR